MSCRWSHSGTCTHFCRAGGAQNAAQPVADCCYGGGSSGDKGVLGLSGAITARFVVAALCVVSAPRGGAGGEELDARGNGSRNFLCFCMLFPGVVLAVFWDHRRGVFVSHHTAVCKSGLAVDVMLLNVT